MSKDGVDNYLQTCIAMDTPIVLHPEMAKEIQQLIEVAPCPVCNTNCSGCLEDLAAKQEGLRELLSDLRQSYPDAAQYSMPATFIDRLTSLLDGEQ